ncbi:MULTISPECIES: hypothetical protein [Azorhizobium]|uniref:hypothetical protein n=1 Tax=Azorhizobium TaxID=6 RepID=UPI001061812B|nr:hypothetical protein [Azorhizobium sp. AG788]TDT96781.1 hypothetical protein DFO45_1981 [Azorhizobium sp. AG788]
MTVHFAGEQPPVSQAATWSAATLGAGEAYEAACLAQAAGISREEAMGLVRRHGTHRATLMAAARRLKRG